MSDQISEQSERAQKAPYETPKADFIPLKLQERLLWCGDTSGVGEQDCDASM